MTQSAVDDMTRVTELAVIRQRLEAELAKVIVGQRAIVEQILICLCAGGHGLLIGVPGLAKTSLIRAFSEILDLRFKRIQFTPDLMPSDITGTEVLVENRQSGEREFRFLQGPIFANIILADEINRTPPKTQAALLEAMQEFQVTAGGQDYPLPLPFFVLATQNPIEQEGTYPLPEAQLDRFMFSVYLDYPSSDDEVRIVKETTSARETALERVLNAEQIIALQQLVRRVPVSDDLVRYAVRLAQSSRPAERSDGELARFIATYVNWGAGPRASQYLVLGAKARAILHGRPCVAREDIVAVVEPVLRHRILTNFRAEAEGVTPREVIRRLVQSTPA